MNKLLPADQVARELVDEFDKAVAGMTKKEKRSFLREFVEVIYRFNGFPPVLRKRR